jgi:hypothetical protein
MSFIEVMKTTIFKNVDRFDGAEPIMRGKPNFSNGKVTLHTAIPPGEYSISCWQWLDTGNISLTMSRREEEQQQARPAPQAQSQSQADDAISELGGEADGFR